MIVKLEHTTAVWMQMERVRQQQCFRLNNLSSFVRLYL